MPIATMERGEARVQRPGYLLVDTPWFSAHRRSALPRIFYIVWASLPRAPTCAFCPARAEPGGPPAFVHWESRHGRRITMRTRKSNIGGRDTAESKRHSSRCSALRRRNGCAPQARSGASAISGQWAVLRRGLVISIRGRNTTARSRRQAIAVRVSCTVRRCNVSGHPMAAHIFALPRLRGHSSPRCHCVERVSWARGAAVRCGVNAPRVWSRDRQ
jgi:hypothetical protein